MTMLRQLRGGIILPWMWYGHRSLATPIAGTLPLRGWMSSMCTAVPCPQACGSCAGDRYTIWVRLHENGAAFRYGVGVCPGPPYGDGSMRKRCPSVPSVAQSEPSAAMNSFISNVMRELVAVI